MRRIEGGYNEAYVYARTLEEAAEEQIRTMCSLPFLKNSRIRIMPDVHAGDGCTIGTTMTIGDAVVPGFVGVDIGCGMEAVLLQEREIDFPQLDKVIRQYVPSGFEIREEPHPNMSQIRLSDLYCAEGIDTDRVERSLGTLGGGNHFIEVDQDGQGRYWLVIHSGSRSGGTDTARWYKNGAVRQLKQRERDAVNEMISRMKEEGREREIPAAVRKMAEEFRQTRNTDYAYCSGQLLEEYLHDMEIMQRYADLNRKTIAEEIMTHMGWHRADSFTTIHNYIDTEHMILRKGAVSARKGERLLIPVNMRDGSLICVGRGNEEWNCSAPHGAGRICSRRAAKENFSLTEYEQAMEGIYSTSVSMDTIDESPMAYKPMDEIVFLIGDTCEIINVIRPVYNFKAG